MCVWVWGGGGGPAHLAYNKPGHMIGLIHRTDGSNNLRRVDKRELVGMGIIYEEGRGFGGGGGGRRRRERYMAMMGSRMWELEKG